MTEQITLSLPASLFQRARIQADRSGRPMDSILIEAIERSLVPLGNLEDRAPENWTDNEVLTFADSQMPPAEDARLSELLDRQQAGSLQERERAELTALMECYQTGLLRKAQALAEAVRRGLRPAVQP